MTKKEKAVLVILSSEDLSELYNIDFYEALDIYSKLDKLEAKEIIKKLIDNNKIKKEDLKGFFDKDIGALNGLVKE